MLCVGMQNRDALHRTVIDAERRKSGSHAEHGNEGNVCRVSAMSETPPTDTNTNDYVVVARRYRPRTFDELIGQQHVSQALSRAIASERVGHAYLFTGARGVGKTSAARILAKALNCAKGTSPTPCNECEICASVGSGDDIDVLEIDGASNRGIDEIRQLRQNVAVRPSRARFKIYIIDEVHMLTKEAFNALLKTLEEPPEHVKFIFATTEPNKIPVTILSRCQRYDFAGIETGAIQERLEQIAAAEGVAVEPDALQILAMRAAGSMRDSQSLLEQLLSTGSPSISATDVTGMLGIAPATRLSELALSLVQRNAAEGLQQLDASINEGAEVSQLIDQLLGYFRDVMTQSVGCDSSQMLYALPCQQQEISEAAEKLGVETLLAIIQVLDQSAARMRVSTHTRTLAEMAVVRICSLENLDDLSTLVEQLEQSGSTPAVSPLAKKNESARPAPVRAAPAASRTAPSNLPSPSSVTAAPAAEPVTSTAEPSAAPEPTPLSADNAEEIWKQALDSLTGIVADHAAAADEVSVDQEGRLAVSFTESFHREICERPGNRSRLETALESVCGTKVPLQLRTSTRVDAAEKPAPPRASRRQQQLEIASQPFVQKAMELFDGDPARLRYVPPED